jgi:hypothetical protein
MFSSARAFCHSGKLFKAKHLKSSDLLLAGLLFLSLQVNLFLLEKLAIWTGVNKQQVSSEGKVRPKQ